MTKLIIPKERRLHLGCGLTAPQGWVNVDGSWNAWVHQHPAIFSLMSAARLVSHEESSVKWPTNILIWNLRKPLPFPDGHFDCLYASHLVEHLHHNDGLALLREGHRVLRSGGVIRIAVPDLRSLAEDYVNDKVSANGQSQTAADRFQDAMLLRAKNRAGGGILRTLYSSTQDLHSHKWLYDEESLFESLSTAGFVKIRRCQFLDSKIESIKDVEDESRVCRGNLCMEGEKN